MLEKKVEVTMVVLRTVRSTYMKIQRQEKIVHLRIYESSARLANIRNGRSRKRPEHDGPCKPWQRVWTTF